MSFYQLAVLDDNGGELFVPIDKVSALGIRQLLEKSEIPNLLGQLRKATAAATNWKQRAMDNVKLLASGSAFDLARVVESLTAANATKALSPRERETLDRARRILICEISEVMGETKSAAAKQLDQALQGNTQ
jgi:CarD family transcriptional regulator, regulator of rRNA transcription